jgi:hypothetical protein
MKTFAAWFGLAVALSIATPVPGAAESATGTQNRYLVISSHSKEGCLSALDDFAKDPALASKFDWGCKVGHHKGYAIVEAPDEKAAIAPLPASQRAQAQAILMTKYPPEKLHEIHQRLGR